MLGLSFEPVSANAGRLYPAQAVSDQQQHEQGDRKSDAKRERLDGPITFAFVAHQENQCGTETGEYQDEGDDDNDFHVGAQRRPCFSHGVPPDKVGIE